MYAHKNSVTSGEKYFIDQLTRSCFSTAHNTNSPTVICSFMKQYQLIVVTGPDMKECYHCYSHLK